MGACIGQALHGLPPPPACTQPANAQSHLTSNRCVHLASYSKCNAGPALAIVLCKSGSE